MRKNNYTIEEYLKVFKIPAIFTAQYLELSKGTSIRAMKALIPMATQDKFKHPMVQEWYKMIMPKLQKEGWHFHESFARASVLWNNSIHADAYGFRLPYDFGKYKYEKGKKRDNSASIINILSLQDNKDMYIAKAIGIPMHDLWPEEILGNNQFQSRRSDAEGYIIFWNQYGGKDKFQELQKKFSDTRKAFRETLLWFNRRKGMPFQIQSDMTRHPVVLSLFSELIQSGEINPLKNKKT